MQKLSGNPVVPATSGEPALRGMRVLVVDDSDLNLEVIERILEQAGAQVLLASNGQEAFERIKAEPGCQSAGSKSSQLPLLGPAL